MAKSIVSDKQTRYERGDGRMEAVPAGSTSLPGLLRLDGNAVDIQPTGPQAAGSNGLAADSGHVHFCSGAFLCAPSSYAPASKQTLTVTGTTMAPFSSANVNTGSFTAPASGSVVVQVSCVIENGTAATDINIGLAAHGTSTPMVGNVITFNDNSASTPRFYNLTFLVTGLTRDTSYNFDLMGGCGTAGDTVSILAIGQSSTTAVSSNGGPATMTVQAV